jgi:hypothetical protein
MKTSQIWKLLILFMLIIAFAIIYYNVKNNLEAALYMSATLLTLWISRAISKKITNSKYNNLIKENKRTSANILSTKVHNKSTILQLQISQGGQTYITSYVYRVKKNEDSQTYTKGQSVQVYVNPDDKNDIYIPQISKERIKRFRINWGILITVVATAAPIIIPLAIAFFDTSGREFKDVAYLRAGENQVSLWELRFEEPSKVYLNIYDPIAQTKTLTFKDKKEKELSYSTGFFITSQNQNIVIVGASETPVFDTYDPVTHKKISEIKDFEQKYEFLNKGIVRIELKSIQTKFIKDKVIQIVTTDGKGFYYNIDRNTFYNSLEEIEKQFKKEDMALLTQHMHTFALSHVKNSPVDNHQLFLVEATSKRGIDDLYNCAGSDNLDMNYFNKSYYYRYKYCNLVPLSKDDFFISGKIIYYDFDLIIIQYLESASADAELKIKAFDTTGKTIFKIELNDYPNVSMIKTDKASYLKNYYCEKVVRDNGKIIFMFEEYGALCMDLETGKQVWKFEP